MGLFGSSKEDKELISKLSLQIEQQQKTIDALNKNFSSLQEKMDIKESKNESKDDEIIRLKDIIQKQNRDIDNLKLEIVNQKEESNVSDCDFVCCSGNYLVGRDIPLGGYIFKQKGESNAYISLYPSYNKFKKEEDEIVYQSFSGEFHLSLMENGTYLQVENADIYRKNGCSAFELKAKGEIETIKSEIKILNDQTIMKYYIFSDYEGITSVDCQNKLLLLKQREKELRNLDNDIVTTDSEDNKKLLEHSIRQILRNFNAECDNITFNVGLKNIDNSRKKIQQSYETLNKLYSIDGVQISKELLELKLEQITLMYTYELKCQQEKDIQRAIKEQMVEEAKAQREIEEQKKKIEKDLQQHLGEVNRLMKYLQKTQIDAEKQLYMDKIKELEDKIKELEADKKTVLDREANAKAGFVYIISNIGSFGEDIYKIGMTRRLEPMDRINELSSASVPFEFDVHAMIFSSDAPELENTLHKHFADKAVNKVNPRKEFYNVDIDEIEKVVKENYNDTVQFTKIPIATEYRQSLNISEVAP